MTDTITPPEGMITVELFAQSNGMLEGRVIDMIREGFYTGRVIEGTWFIDNVEQRISAEKAGTNKHSHQDDLDKAQSASTVGSTLSTISTFLHAALIATYFMVSGAPKDAASIFMVFAVCLGVLASWAIIHALLSIVVTNALTAKYVIYLSSKK